MRSDQYDHIGSVLITLQNIFSVYQIEKFIPLNRSVKIEDRFSQCMIQKCNLYKNDFFVLLGLFALIDITFLMHYRHESHVLMIP